MGASNAPTRSRRARGVGESPPDAYWAGPGHPLGWTYGSDVYEWVTRALRELEYVAHPFDLRALRDAAHRHRAPLLLLDVANNPSGDHALHVDGADTEDTYPPHTWPEGWEFVYSLCVVRSTLSRALADLPTADRGYLFLYGPRKPLQILAGGVFAIVMPWTTCPYQHLRDGGRYYEAGVARECPLRDCVMGRLYGWDWRPPTRWEFCEAIGEQGRSAWVPVPADAPRTEPCEVGTEAVPLAHRFHRDGRP